MYFNVFLFLDNFWISILYIFINIRTWYQTRSPIFDLFRRKPNRHLFLAIIIYSNRKSVKRNSLESLILKLCLSSITDTTEYVLHLLHLYRFWSLSDEETVRCVWTFQAWDWLGNLIKLVSDIFADLRVAWTSVSFGSWAERPMGVLHKLRILSWKRSSIRFSWVGISLGTRAGINQHRTTVVLFAFSFETNL